jgi:pimeloyl-ACP methyl ester carboxylesterase
VRFLVIGAVLVVGLLLGACAASSGPGSGIPADGLVDVGGRDLYIECTGTGPVTLVMEAGLGMDTATWSNLVPLLGGARVCAYDRAGQGKSAPAETPRTADDLVNDLSRLLDAASIEPPLVLVGHSFGGLVARLFAARHPEDVAGVVLIDPSPSTLVEDTCELRDATRCAQLTTMLTPDGNPERIDWTASVAELAGAGALPEVPLVVLAATSQGAEISPEEAERWLARQQELVDSVPTGRLIAVDSGHFIHLDRPEEVAEAIRSVLEAIRGR